MRSDGLKNLYQKKNFWNKNFKCVIFPKLYSQLFAVWSSDTLCDWEARAPRRCADKSSFLTQLSDSVSFRGCFQPKAPLRIWRNCRTNWRTNSHTGSFILSFIWKAKGPQEVGWLHKTMNNNTHVVILRWHFSKLPFFTSIFYKSCSQSSIQRTLKWFYSGQSQKALCRDCKYQSGLSESRGRFPNVFGCVANIDKTFFCPTYSQSLLRWAQAPLCLTPSLAWIAFMKTCNTISL